MRILHINSARNFGGGEKHLVELVEHLAARGHELYIAHAPDSSLATKLATTPDIKLFSVRMRNALDLTSAWRLARFIRENKIKIVHAHPARDYTLAALAVALANLHVENERAKLIITRHVSFPLGRLHKLTFACAARVIAVSNSVATQLTARKFIDENKIRVIHNGVDFQRLDAQLQNFNREIYRQSLIKKSSSRMKFLVGTIGDLTPNKGHGSFLRAAKSVHEKLGDEVKFVIVGADASPKQTTRRDLEKLIGEFKLENCVHLLGRREDLAPLLSSLDLFVSASRTEAFGLAMVEALACGVPVVATATDGAREIITDENLGMLVPIDDAEAMAHAISSLLEDENRRARINAYARAAVRVRFNLERMIDETETIYREALEELNY